MMRFQVRLSSFLLVAAGCVVCAGASAQSSSSSSTAPARSPSAPAPDMQAPLNGTYVVVDPLAGVKYDERWDLSLGAAYGHIKAGPPPLLEGANLGGLDVSASYWLSRRWAVE